MAVVADPEHLADPPQKAASIKGAGRSARTVSLDAMEPVDLVVTGCGMNGISLGTDQSAVVERCTVSTVGAEGIRAGVVGDSGGDVDQVSADDGRAHHPVKWLGLGAAPRTVVQQPHGMPSC